MALSKKRINALLTQAKNATTTKSQGDAFEDLLCYIFESVPGISVTRRNVKNTRSTEEIDIAFWNDRRAKGFEFLPNILLAECKHWTIPVGSEQVSWFAEKLRHRGLQYGFLFAHLGITGDPDNLRQAYSIVDGAQRDGIRLIVLTTAEILGFSSHADLVLLVKEKLCDLAVRGGL